MNIKDRFSNKIAIVTGGADGIGKGVASRLGKEGAVVALFDINEELLTKTAAEFEMHDIEVMPCVVDVSNETQVAEAFRKVEQKHGGIDIVINAAGIVGPTSTKITEFETKDFDKIYEVNLKGSFLIAKYALTAMKKKGTGRILLIASIAGKEGNPGMVGYSATKAAVIGLAKGVAKEFADTGITVNALAPAVIKTAMNDNTSQEQLAYMTAKIPMQRLGTIDEVAAMCCYIVSDENSFSTGFTYDISGGRATY
ncbi:MAG: SDR family NAD(P)-dependent oxidoreductase [Agriterribacter sp.]